MIETFNCIEQCVKDYYKDSSEEDVILGADDLFPIFEYVVIKSNCKHLWSECAFQDDFMPDPSGKKAYVLATLQASLMDILNLGEEHTEQNFETQDEQKE